MESQHASCYLLAVLDALARAQSPDGDPLPGHVGHAARALRAAGLLSSPSDDAARKALDRYLASLDEAATREGTATARGYLRTLHPRSDGQPRKARQPG
jgi:hypothetical protein